MDSVRAATESLGMMFAERSAVVLIVLLAAIVTVLVIVWIVYKIKRTELQSASVLSRPVKLFDNDEVISLEKGKVPGTINGQEFSFSFWLYIAELQPASQPYVVFYRTAGVVTQSSVPANPIVMVNSKTNKMHICIRTNNSKTNDATLEKVLSRGFAKPLDNWVVATIDYVPLQRWVHVAFAISDNLLTVYMDGDMYTVENVMELADPTTSRRPIFAPTTGDIVVGRVPGGAELRGYIARLQFFNYALTKADVASLVGAGPSERSVLAALGLPAYGVRSPIYRVDPV